MSKWQKISCPVCGKEVAMSPKRKVVFHHNDYLTRWPLRCYASGMTLKDSKPELMKFLVDDLPFIAEVLDRAQWHINLSMDASLLLDVVMANIAEIIGLKNDRRT